MKSKRIRSKALTLAIATSLTTSVITCVATSKTVQALTPNEIQVISQYRLEGQNVNDVLRCEPFALGNIADNTFYLKLPTTIQTRDMLSMITVIGDDNQPIQCEGYLCYDWNKDKVLSDRDIAPDDEYMGDTIRVKILGNAPKGNLYVIVNMNKAHYVDSSNVVRQGEQIGKYCLLSFKNIDSQGKLNEPPSYSFNFQPDIKDIDGRKHSSIDKTKGKDVKLIKKVPEEEKPLIPTTSPATAPHVVPSTKTPQGVQTKDKAKDEESVEQYVAPTNSIVETPLTKSESLTYLASGLKDSLKESLIGIPAIIIILVIALSQIRTKNR